MSSTEHSHLRSNCTLTSISEDDDWVYATYLDASGAEKKIRGRFLVGADGKTGFTRKNYLEPRGIEMQWAEEQVDPYRLWQHEVSPANSETQIEHSIKSLGSH